MHFSDWGGAMGWGGMWMALWWILPIVGIVVLVKWLGGAEGRRQEKTALDLLKERYARGEIDQAEFERMRQQLES